MEFLLREHLCLLDNGRLNICFAIIYEIVATQLEDNIDGVNFEFRTPIKAQRYNGLVEKKTDKQTKMENFPKAKKNTKQVSGTTFFTQNNMCQPENLIIFGRSNSESVYYVEFLCQFCETDITFGMENLGKKKTSSDRKQWAVRPIKNWLNNSSMLFFSWEFRK